jgi:hypothetical protein
LASIVDSVIPLFVVILAGYVAGRMRLLDQAGVRTLVAFVFNFAMPPLLFRLMAHTDVGAIGSWSFFAAYLSAQVPVFLAGALLGGLALRMSFAELTIQGFGSSFSNGVVLGLPLVLSLYGERGGVPGLLIITLDVLVFSTVTLMLELGQRREVAAPGRIVWQATLQILKNPLIMATFAGIVVGLFGLPLPGVVDKTLGFVGQAGPPAALFALGATLSLRRFAGSLNATLFMVAFKLLLHPTLAALAVTYVFRLDPIWASVAVIFAAGPVGANTYVFAQHYEVGVETSSSAILISTALSMLTISALLLVLPAAGP